MGGTGMERERSGGGVGLYLLLTMLLCAAPYALMARYGVSGGAGGYVTALMWGPAVAAILTVWLLKLDWSSLGFAWRGTSSSWASYLLPIGYAGLAYVIVWTTGMGRFATPESIAPLAAQIGWTIEDPTLFAALFFVFTGVTGIIVGTARGLGEEIGWRGFMAPRLQDRFGFTRAAAITGLIWATWHVPLILYADYNSAAPRGFALVCFFVMVMNLSFIMAWFRLKSGSVWPAAIMHGSHNLFIQRIFTPLTEPTGDITAYAIDEFGFMLAITSFAVALYLWFRRGEAVAAHEARRSGRETA